MRRPLVLVLLVLLVSVGQAQAAAPSAAPGTTAAPPPVFRTETVTAARLGSSHRPGCPVPVADLRLVTVTHVRFDGTTSLGELVVHRDAAPAVVRVFRELLSARFPVAQVRTVEAYGSDDARSMAANNTSAFNCRRTTGAGGWSEHAYGRALDLNPVQNPYVRRTAQGTIVLPAAGRAHVDRSRPRPGMVLAGGPVVRAFGQVGWRWGGSFTSLKDYQHFSVNGR